MLQKQTVETATLELLRELMRDEYLSNFFLVGGTALSLCIGHRISIDLDLFSDKSFDAEILRTHLTNSYNFSTDFQQKNTLKGFIKNVKVDIISHEYQLVKPLRVIEEIRMAHLLDIASMKLNAIIGNGSRLKDFIDITHLSSLYSLEEMMEAFSTKYPHANPIIIPKAILYHNDIDFTDPIQLIDDKPFKFSVIEQRLIEMVKKPAQIFPEI